MLTVTEELLLLLVDDQKGALINTEPFTLDSLTASGILTDLLLANRIKVDEKGIRIIEDTPLDDDLLDSVLSTIATHSYQRDEAYWIETIARKGEDFRDRVLEKLVEKQILQTDESGIHLLTRWVRDTRRYPKSIHDGEREVRSRILELLLSDDKASTRDSALVALAHVNGIFSAMMSPQEFDEVSKRIQEISRKATAISRLARGVSKGLARKAVRPRAKGLPLIGSSIAMAGDVGSYLTQQYLKLGPVFKVKMLNREFTVLAGAEANSFVHRHGREYLRSKEAWQDFDRELGAARSMVSADGSEHYELRKNMRDGFSRNTIARNLDESVAIVRRKVEELPDNKPQRTLYMMQRIVTEQLGVLATGVSPADYLDDLILFLESILALRVTKTRSRLDIITPRVRRARQRLLEFSRKVVEAHATHLRQNKSPDLIDACIAMHRGDPDLVPETDLIITVLGPFFAGLETAANASSFLLYALLKNPELMERSREEADNFFAGDLSIESVDANLDVLQRSFLEAMRVYPVVPAIIRTVSNTFEFGGYRIPAGEQVLIALSVPFSLPNHFRDPEKFDIDRYLPERAEHRPMGVYVPFGLGTHRCLGADFAETMVISNIATLIHDYDVSLNSPKYELKINQIPTPHPDNGFRIRVNRRVRELAKVSSA